MSNDYIAAWVGPGDSRIYQHKDGTLMVRSGGTVSWRNNNPGNLIKNDFSNRKNAIGGDRDFAIFPSLENGEKARHDLLYTKGYQEKSLVDAIYKYAPPEYNDAEAYIKDVQSRTGLSRNIPMSSLSTEQMNSLLQAIKAHEKFTVGDEKPFRLGDAEYQKLKDFEKIDPIWALGQPVTNLTDQNIRDVMNSKEYLKTPKNSYEKYMQTRVHNMVHKWFKAHEEKHSDSGVDAMGRMIGTADAKNSGDAGGGNEGGDVSVSAYDRGNPKGGMEHVSAYTRSTPHRRDSGQSA